MATNKTFKCRSSVIVGVILASLAAVCTSIQSARATCKVQGGGEAQQCTGTPPDTYYYNKCRKVACKIGTEVCKKETGYVRVWDAMTEVWLPRESSGDPVVFPAGAYVEQKLDVQAGQLGESFAVVRYHSSEQTFSGSPLGDEWDSSLCPRITEPVAEDEATVYLGYSDPAVITKIDDSYVQTENFSLTKISGKFEIHYDNGAKIYFDSYNNAVTKTLRTGLRYEWIYDGNQDLQTIEMNDTAVIAVEWDYSPDRITKVTNLQTSDTVSYYYTAGGQLTKVQGGCSSCSNGSKGAVYTYVASGNGAGCIEEIQDLANNRQLKMVYDNSARVVTQYRNTDPVYATYSYQSYGTGIYSYTDFESDELRIYLDDNGRTTKEENYHDSVLGGSFAKYYSDTTGDVTRQRWLVSISGATTKWREEQFEYDSSNRLTMEILYDASSPITRLVRYYEDTFNNVTTETFANGRTNIYDYDAEGLMLTKTVQASGASNVTEWWAYDGNGQRLTYSNANGVLETYDYDANGNLATKTLDPTGLAIQNIYFRDGLCRVTLYKDYNGNERKTYYGDSNQVTKKVDPNGLTTDYVYDSAGHMVTQEVYDDGGSITRTTIHVYDALGRMITMKHPLLGHMVYAYDGNDRVTYEETLDGVKTGTVYNSTGKRSYNLTYDGSAWITRFSYFYDMEGHLTKKTDANGTVVSNSPEYDSYGRVDKDTDPLGNYTITEFDDAGNVTRQIAYDSGDNAVAEIRMEYDSLGRGTRARVLASPGDSTSTTDDMVLDMVYDADSNVLTYKTYVSGDETGTPTTMIRAYVYDNAGRAITETVSDGPTVAKTYDNGGNLITQTIDPGGLHIQTIYEYDWVGRKTRLVKPDGTSVVSLYAFSIYGKETKRITYDSNDTPIAAYEYVHYPSISTTTKMTTYTYSDPANNITAATADDPTEVWMYTSANYLLTKYLNANNATTYDYDAHGWQITETDPAGNKSINHRDNNGRVITRERIDSADVGSDQTFTTAYEFDAMYHITKTIEQGPDGDIISTGDNLESIVSYNAPARQTLIQGPKDQKQALIFDGLGRVTRQIEDYSGNDPRYTDYKYDRAGRLTQAIGYTDGVGGITQATDYAYNRSGVKTLVTYPNGGTVSFILDSVNRATRQTDPRGIHIDKEYDALGQVTLKHEGSNVYWTYEYDALGKTTLALKGTSSGGEQIARTDRYYNGLGRLTRERQQITGALTKSVDYDYDMAGNITALYYPGGDVTIVHTYTDISQINVVSRLSASSDQIADYDYVGKRVRRLTYDTGTYDVTVNRIYDGARRLSRLTWDQVSNTLPKFNYDYDKAGNILTISYEHYSAGTKVSPYEYDGLYRLTHARYDAREVTHQFEYDNLGNWLTYTADAVVQTRLHNDVNEITRLNTTQIYHDDAGNLTRDGSDGTDYRYYYDAENRLTHVSKVDGQTEKPLASHKYDALGRRIEYIDYTVGRICGPNDTFLYLYDGRREIEEYGVVEILGGGLPRYGFSRFRYYIWGNYIDELLVMHDDDADKDYFVCHNHLYSPEALLDDTGSIVERYDYDAYGKPYIYTATAAGGGDGDWWDGDETTATTSAKGLPYLFTGRRYDALRSDNLKLYYYRARHYHPNLGRFLQRDPAKYIDGMNLYQYVRSNPVYFTDPTGNYREEIHRDWTTRAAFAAGDAYLLPETAHAIGNADVGVDSLWSWIFGLGWHFDVDADPNIPAQWGPGDDRWKHYEDQRLKAFELCDAGEGKKAAREFGKGLHSVQDWYAHGNWRVWVWKLGFIPWPQLHPKWYDDTARDGSGSGGMIHAARDGYSSKGRHGYVRSAAMKHSAFWYIAEFFMYVHVVGAWWSWANTPGGKKCHDEIFLR